MRANTKTTVSQGWHPWFKATIAVTIVSTEGRPADLIDKIKQDKNLAFELDEKEVTILFGGKRVSAPHGGLVFDEEYSFAVQAGGKSVVLSKNGLEEVSTSDSKVVSDMILSIRDRSPIRRFGPNKNYFLWTFDKYILMRPTEAQGEA